MTRQNDSRPLSDDQWRLGPLSAEEVLALPAAVDFVDAGRALGLKRATAYELAQHGEFPVPLLQIGRVRKVRRSDLLRHLGIEDTVAAARGGDAA